MTSDSRVAAPSDEVLEALNRIYAGWWCVPLSSGRIALFTHPLKPDSLRIAASWEHVLTLERPKERFTFRPPAQPRSGSGNLSIKLDL